MKEKILNGGFEQGTDFWVTEQGNHEAFDQSSYNSNIPPGNNTVTEIDGLSNVADTISQTFDIGPGQVDLTQPLTFLIAEREGFGEIGGLGVQIIDLTTGLPVPLTGIGGAFFSDFGGGILEVDAVSDLNLNLVTINFTPTNVGLYQLRLIDTERGVDGVGVIIDDVSISAICYAGSTNLLTPSGEKPVEELSSGDLLVTSSNEVLPIQWIGKTTYSAAQLSKNPKLCPVKVSRGSLGPETPRADLWVSRQHRILAASQIVERMCNEPEVLIPAINLTALPGVYVDTDVAEVEYFHVLLERHEVIIAEGCMAESFFCGPMALNSLSSKSRKEISKVRPELMVGQAVEELARCVPPSSKRRNLVRRHVENRKSIYETGVDRGSKSHGAYAA